MTIEKIAGKIESVAAIEARLARNLRGLRDVTQARLLSGQTTKERVAFSHVTDSGQ